MDKNVMVGKKTYLKPQMEEIAMQTESMIAESTGGVTGSAPGMPWGDEDDDENSVKEKSSYEWE